MKRVLVLSTESEFFIGVDLDSNVLIQMYYSKNEIANITNIESKKIPYEMFLFEDSSFCNPLDVILIDLIPIEDFDNIYYFNKALKKINTYKLLNSNNVRHVLDNYCSSSFFYNSKISKNNCLYILKKEDVNINNIMLIKAQNISFTNISKKENNNNYIHINFSFNKQNYTTDLNDSEYKYYVPNSFKLKEAYLVIGYIPYFEDTTLFVTVFKVINFTPSYLQSSLLIDKLWQFAYFNLRNLSDFKCFSDQHNNHIICKQCSFSQFGKCNKIDYSKNKSAVKKNYIRSWCDCCLAEVHSYLHNDNDRDDYKCIKLIHYYTFKYLNTYHKYLVDLFEFFNHEINDCFNKVNNLSILSIGCGASPDLIYFFDKNLDFPISYLGLDINPLWKDVHLYLEDIVQQNNSDNFSANLIIKDIFDIECNDNFFKNKNFLIFQFLISHLFISQIQSKEDTLLTKLWERINICYHNRIVNQPFYICVIDIANVTTEKSKKFLYFNNVIDELINFFKKNNILKASICWITFHPKNLEQDISDNNSDNNNSLNQKRITIKEDLCTSILNYSKDIKLVCNNFNEDVIGHESLLVRIDDIDSDDLEENFEILY